MTGEAVGSTANTFSFGQAFFSTCAHPVMWPPVPTPVMSASNPSGKSARISFAVVRACTSTFAGFSNCCGIHAPGVLSRSSSALAIEPFMPSARGVSTSVAP